MRFFFHSLTDSQIPLNPGNLLFALHSFMNVCNGEPSLAVCTYTYVRNACSELLNVAREAPTPFWHWAVAAVGGGMPASKATVNVESTWNLFGKGFLDSLVPQRLKRARRRTPTMVIHESRADVSKQLKN